MLCLKDKTLCVRAAIILQDVKKKKGPIFAKFIEGKRNLILVVTFISSDSIERRSGAGAGLEKWLSHQQTGTGFRSADLEIFQLNFMTAERCNCCF